MRCVPATIEENTPDAIQFGCARVSQKQSPPRGLPHVSRGKVSFGRATLKRVHGASIRNKRGGNESIGDGNTQYAGMEAVRFTQELRTRISCVAALRKLNDA